MKKNLLFIIIIITLILIPVRAENNIIVSNHNNKEKISSSAIQLGDNLEVEKEIEGIGLIIGNTINISNKQDYLFALGNNVNIKNATTKDLFVAGNNISIDSKNIQRDVYILGNYININNSIPRDLFVAGSSVNISNDIGNDLKVASDNITIRGKINGNAYIDSEKIIIEDGTEITGKLSYPKDANIKISKESTINKIEKFSPKNEENNILISTLKDRILAYLNLLLIGILAIYFLKIGNKEEEINSKYITKNTYRGSIILLLTPFLLFGLLLLYGITTGLVFTILALYIVMIYLSSIPVAIYLANTLLKQINNIYLSFLIVLFTFYLLRFIPILGGIITIIIIAFGLGIISYYLQDKLLKKEIKK